MCHNIIKTMTLEEKINMLAGKDFWRTLDLPEYGIPSIEVSDGPCGVRKQKRECDHLGFYGSEPSTACVSGPALAASFNKKLFEKTGELLGEECKSYGVDLLLGPAVNIQKSPLCGRNFEYFSEDPVLAGKAAAGFIKGVQKTGVGACIKHFAANNQETEREYIDAKIEERALREIYLKVFEIAIKEAKPWAVMTALNKVNGEYCAENKHLLTEILREEWKYEGFVMSDWWGLDDRVRALNAGLDLEMPTSMGVGAEKLRNAIQKGEIKEADLEKSCERIINCGLTIQKKENDNGEFDREKHHNLAKEQALEGIVLLKNEASLLPLSTQSDILVLGELAVKPRFRLEGSALVNPTMQDIPLEEMEKVNQRSITYEKGYGEEGALERAVCLAKGAKTIIIFAGLLQGMESEGHDRKNLKLPTEHDILIDAVGNVNRNVVVVLAGGGAVEMPWCDKVSAILECFLAGQAMGSALAEIVFGKVNPSGKLPVTFPEKMCHLPDYFTYPGNKVSVEYREGIFTGYRYYEKKKIKPLFPFGHGLSYTEFTYRNLSVDLSNLKQGGKACITVSVKNIGTVVGAEVVQLYVGASDARVRRPEKELKEFEKLVLEPGEEKTVSFSLIPNDFSYYHEELEDWYVEEGIYSILVGASSADIRQVQEIYLKPELLLPKKLTGWSNISRFTETETGRQVLDEMKGITEHAYCEPGLFEMLQLGEYHDTKIRFLTLQTQTVLDNTRIEQYLYDCNQEILASYRKEKSNIPFIFEECKVMER